MGVPGLVRWALSLALVSTLGCSPTHDHPGEGRGPAGKVAVTARCPSLPPSPNWAPAFAGVVGGGPGGVSRRGASCRSHPSHLPGGGRGPGGKVAVATCCPALPRSPNWASAFAGVVPSPLRAAGTISTNSIVQAASLAPPRRRPGSRWGGRCDDALSFVTVAPQLGPGLRRGGREEWGSSDRWPNVELFPREGGDPVWAPAFAGEQGAAAYGEGARDTLEQGGGRAAGIA